MADDETTELRLILAMAPSFQGGHSKISKEVPGYLGIPFPLTTTNLEKIAMMCGFDPYDIWPWLKPTRTIETCELCGGSSVLRNLATLSPADDEPCPCTYEEESKSTIPINMIDSISDPDVWDADRLAQEVAFTISPAGRLRREDREIAFALEIERLRAALSHVRDVLRDRPDAWPSWDGETGKIIRKALLENQVRSMQ